MARFSSAKFENFTIAFSMSHHDPGNPGNNPAGGTESGFSVILQKYTSCYPILGRAVFRTSPDLP
jgi:hypothetical protein